MDCPDLEQVFEELAEGKGPALEHARSCPRCSLILEEHRQLEKDLFRLADPMPPPDFVHRVMDKVRAAPVPVKREVFSGIAILAATFAAISGSLFAGGPAFAFFGVKAAHFAVALRELGVGLAAGIAAIWSTAAIPVVAVLLVVLTTSLLGLRRLVNSNVNVVEARVS